MSSSNALVPSDRSDWNQTMSHLAAEQHDLANQLQKLEQELAELTSAGFGQRSDEWFNEMDQKILSLHYRMNGDNLVLLKPIPKQIPKQEEKAVQSTPTVDTIYEPIPLQALCFIGGQIQLIDLIESEIRRYNANEEVGLGLNSQPAQEEAKKSDTKKYIVLIPHEALVKSLDKEFIYNYLCTYMPNLKKTSYLTLKDNLSFIIDTRPTDNKELNDDMRGNIEAFKSRFTDPRKNCLEYSSANAEDHFNHLMLFLTRLCGIKPVPGIVPLSQKQLRIQYETKTKQSIADAFKKIYAAMYDGEQTGFKSKDFLKSVYKVVMVAPQGTAMSSHFKRVREMSFGSLTDIIDEKEPTARSVAALSLAKKHHSNCYADNKELFNAIYVRSFKESGVFKQAHIAGKTFFRAKSVEEALKNKPQFLVETAEVLPTPKETIDKSDWQDDESRKDIIATRLGKRGG